MVRRFTDMVTLNIFFSTSFFQGIFDSHHDLYHQLTSKRISQATVVSQAAQGIAYGAHVGVVEWCRRLDSDSLWADQIRSIPIKQQLETPPPNDTLCQLSAPFTFSTVPYSRSRGLQRLEWLVDGQSVSSSRFQVNRSSFRLAS